LKKKSKTLVLKKKSDKSDKGKKQGKEKKSKKLVGIKRSHKAVTKNTKAVKKPNKTIRAKGVVLKGKMNKKSEEIALKRKVLKIISYEFRYINQPVMA